MIIKLDNYPSFYNENRVYNEDIVNFVDELLQTSGLGQISYIISELSNFKANKRHQYFTLVKDHKEYLHPQQDEYYEKNYKHYNGKLGPLEFSLASYLLNRKLHYNVIILTGALGSGKTTLSEYVLNFIKTANLPAEDPLSFPLDGVIYKINFNEHFSGRTDEEIGNEFKRTLINSLLKKVKEIHENRLFIDDFIIQVDNDDDNHLNDFTEFGRKVRRQQLPTEELKFEYLLEWLDDIDELNFKLRLVSYLVDYIQQRKGDLKNNDFILFLDNIDRFPDSAQMEILSIIFSFSIKLPIKVLVPMRLTTFGKIRDNGSYNFAVLENTGQPPIHVLCQRLNHFLSNYSEYEINKKISPQFIPVLRHKIEFLSVALTEKSYNNRMSDFFSAISGLSIRRGLSLSERFFANSAFKYTDESLYKDSFLISLLISDNRSGKFATDDRLVNNIFCSLADGGDNTLLNIRILQILSFFRESSIACKMNVLISQLYLFEEYTESHILDAINGLIFYPRRLAYVEGVNEYANESHLFQSMHDVINITYSGTEYLNILLSNVVYLQHSFITVNWKITKSMRSLKYLEKFIENIYNHQRDNSYFRFLLGLIRQKSATITDFIAPAYDFSIINERMKMIRECLYFLLINDLNQLAIYFENNDLQNADAIENRYIKNSIVIDIIAKISVNVFNILKSNSTNKDEIRNWYDLLIITDLWQNQVFQSKTPVIESSLKIYFKEIS